MTKETLWREAREAIVEGDPGKSRRTALKAIELGSDLEELIDKGFVPGIRRLGALWESGEYFLPELIAGAESMKAAMEILQPEMARANIRVRSLGRVVIGTVESDIHDIGKNLVASMLQANGFEVFDLGADVKAEKFIEKAEKEGADLICLSALLTTTMINQKKFLELLVEKDLRRKYKVMVGGAPASQKWADEIGADGYAENAARAVATARRLAGK